MKSLLAALSGGLDSKLGFDLVFTKIFFSLKISKLFTLWPHYLGYSQFSIIYDREFLTFTNDTFIRYAKASAHEKVLVVMNMLTCQMDCNQDLIKTSRGWTQYGRGGGGSYTALPGPIQNYNQIVEKSC